MLVLSPTLVVVCAVLTHPPSSASNNNLMHSPLRGTHVLQVLEGLRSLSGLAPPWSPVRKEGMLSLGSSLISSTTCRPPRGAPNQSQLAAAAGEATFLLVQAPPAGTSLSPENAPEDFHPTCPSGLPQGSGRGRGAGQGRGREVPLQVPGLPSKARFIRGRRSRPSWEQAFPRSL